jgi:hypothetical protein
LLGRPERRAPRRPTRPTPTLTAPPSTSRTATTAPTPSPVPAPRCWSVSPPTRSCACRAVSCVVSCGVVCTYDMPGMCTIERCTNFKLQLDGHIKTETLEIWRCENAHLQVPGEWVHGFITIRPVTKTLIARTHTPQTRTRTRTRTHARTHAHTHDRSTCRSRRCRPI